MAKSYEHAPKICIGLSILALLGIIIGLATTNTIPTIIFLLPTVIYEVYRTEGKNTKKSSWLMLILLISELLLVIFNIELNLAEFLDLDSASIHGYEIPFGDIKVISPSIIAILSIVLITQTRGRFTKWLAAIIFITSFVIIHIIDPTLFTTLLKLAINQGLEKI